MHLSDGQTRLVLFSAGILVLGCIAVYAGIGPVMHTLAVLAPSGLAVIVILHLPVILAMGLAWWCIGRGRGRVGPVAFAAARLGRDAVAEVLPFSQVGGFLAGLRLLTLMGLDAANSAFAMFADLIAEFEAKLLYTALGIWLLSLLLPDSSLIRPFSIALALVVIAFAAVAILYGRFKGMLHRLAIWGAHRMTALQPDTMFAGGAGVFDWKRVLPSFAIHLACWLFGAVEAWFTLRLMGIEVTIGQALVIDSLATAFRTLGFLVPASLGVQEAGYVLACGLFGIPPAGGVAFSLARRARDILIGLAGLAVWQRLELQDGASRLPPNSAGPNRS